MAQNRKAWRVNPIKIARRLSEYEAALRRIQELSTTALRTGIFTYALGQIKNISNEVLSGKEEEAEQEGTS